MVQEKALRKFSLVMCDEQPLFVAEAPIGGPADIQHLRLEERDGARVAVVKISSSAGKRFAQVTRDHIGGTLVVRVNEEETPVIIMSEIETREHVVDVGELELQDLCSSS